MANLRCCRSMVVVDFLFITHLISLVDVLSVEDGLALRGKTSSRLALMIRFSSSFLATLVASRGGLPLESCGCFLPYADGIAHLQLTVWSQSGRRRLNRIQTVQVATVRVFQCYQFDAVSTLGVEVLLHGKF